MPSTATAPKPGDNVITTIDLDLQEVAEKSLAGNLSAYGKGGLLGRWTHYVKSLHGDNKLMKELLCDYPDRGIRTSSSRFCSSCQRP